MRSVFRLLAWTLTTGCGASTPLVDTQLSAPAPTAANVTVAPDDTAGAPTNVSFVATHERIWAALPKAYKAVGITVNAVDTTTRSMGFAGVIRRQLGGTRLSRYFLCGSQIGANADAYDITLYIASQVGRDQQTGRILVTTGLRVAAKSAFGGTMTRCTSSGELERRLQAALRSEMER